MARLPVIGGDEDYWGNVLVEFLEVEHDSDGTHKIHKIRDDDDDTCFETERSADEDIVRAKAGGQDVFYGYNDGIFELVKQSGASMKMSANQTIQNTVWTKLAFDSYDWDIQGEVDTTNNRFTATRAGKYLLCGCISFEANSNGVRHFKIMLNGSTRLTAIRIGAAPAYETTVIFNYITQLDAGDYVEFHAFQTSGGDLAVMNDITRAMVVKIF